MSKISGVLLDFDGVLSSIIVRLGWPFYHALKKVKPKTKREEILLSLNEIMKMLLKVEKRGPLYVPKIIYKISQLLNMNIFQILRFIVSMGVLVRKNNNNVSPEYRADEVLKIVTSQYKTGIITHAEKEVIQEAHKKFKYLKDVGIIITQQDLKFTKPHPEGLTKAMKFLGLNPKETLFVGDLPHDIQAGKRAGTLTVAVVNFKGAEKGKRAVLKKYNPDYIIDHVSELPELINSIEAQSL